MLYIRMKNAEQVVSKLQKHRIVKKLKLSAAWTEIHRMPIKRDYVAFKYSNPGLGEEDDVNEDLECGGDKNAICSISAIENFTPFIS